ncbi:hypothetical protein RchiOBHm_Chr4g0445401 [Rosa chinensis]|uniref:Uncharacterized protein n=1 Tax=Rosa chinensis TaxID=74649 RepID=A0A2P6R4L1_ROSCH|nr:hypothetical protein RchiOBHm_Chr4g0445401 [Rosa chinensis]
MFACSLVVKEFFWLNVNLALYSCWILFFDELGICNDFFLLRFPTIFTESFLGLDGSLLLLERVKNLVLPAALEAESTWTEKFGFTKTDPDQGVQNFRFKLW